MNETLFAFESIIQNKVSSHNLEQMDPAHDSLHLIRVVQTAKKLCSQEKANENIVIPAAWMHDFVVVPKNDPRRKQASKLSAIEATAFLKALNYPEALLPDIAHAIEAHSFSANIEPQTLEAKIVQDADRLDGLGAIGIARCFATAGLIKRPFYSLDDPFCKNRTPNDQVFTIDHFWVKLFKVAESLKTKSGQIEGQLRLKSMKNFLFDFERELQSST